MKTFFAVFSIVSAVLGQFAYADTRPSDCSRVLIYNKEWRYNYEIILQRDRAFISEIKGGDRSIEIPRELVDFIATDSKISVEFPVPGSDMPVSVEGGALLEFEKFDVAGCMQRANRAPTFASQQYAIAVCDGMNHDQEEKRRRYRIAYGIATTQDHTGSRSYSTKAEILFAKDCHL